MSLMQMPSISVDLNMKNHSRRQNKIHIRKLCFFAVFSKVQAFENWTMTITLKIIKRFSKTLNLLEYS
ncbi:CLUMA_CG000535, isoform A [Clunio marinus]|uniref:CLUMA_CG000535, isoform A n=1 Tax=Clunio marinus TaxID=568069 RepID=A0A1J1HJQ4_9DIPT|nr:CLUMA_CG000535, isoform A [Clunio marinus]